MELTPLSRAEFDRIFLDFRHGTREERRIAFLRLEAWGQTAVGFLCEALHGTDPETRASAAAALGSLRAEEALTPLKEVLEAQLHWRLRFPAWVPGVAFCGLLMLGFALILGAFLLGTAVFTPWSGFVVLIYPASIWGVFYVHERRKRDRVLASVMDALAGLAEQRPSPLLIPLVEELRGVSLDPVRHEPATRELAAEAARRIEAATAYLNAIPIPCAPPVPDATGLPRPGGPARVEPDALPRIGAS